jgi:hypothetical protein
VSRQPDTVLQYFSYYQGGEVGTGDYRLYDYEAYGRLLTGQGTFPVEKPLSQVKIIKVPAGEVSPKVKNGDVITVGPYRLRVIDRGNVHGVSILCMFDVPYARLVAIDVALRRFGKKLKNNIIFTCMIWGLAEQDFSATQPQWRSIRVIGSILKRFNHVQR